MWLLYNLVHQTRILQACCTPHKYLDHLWLIYIGQVSMGFEFLYFELDESKQISSSSFYAALPFVDSVHGTLELLSYKRTSLHKRFFISLHLHLF